MHYRHKITKATTEAAASSDIGKDPLWEKIEAGTIDESKVMPPGVQGPAIPDSPKG